MIEERRKRREAIKAKYRGQATPLLVQALQLGNKTESSTPSAIVNDSGRKTTGEFHRASNLLGNILISLSADSPLSSLPRTPNETEPASPILSEPGSGLNSGEDLLKKDDSLRLSSQLNEEEPSAADYDPTMDMQEDRMKQDKRQHGEEMSASAYDETQPQKREIPVPGTSDIQMTSPSPVRVPPGGAKAENKKSADRFDMFAEDFDEDEFAVDTGSSFGGAKLRDPDSITSKKPWESKGKQLDESMLDNWDDPEGYYRIILGELLDGRYNVQANLGKGVFSAVVRATDLKRDGETVAIKVIRANDTM